MSDQSLAERLTRWLRRRRYERKARPYLRARKRQQYRERVRGRLGALFAVGDELRTQPEVVWLASTARRVREELGELARDFHDPAAARALHEGRVDELMDGGSGDTDVDGAADENEGEDCDESDESGGGEDGGWDVDEFEIDAEVVDDV